MADEITQEISVPHEGGGRHARRGAHARPAARHHEQPDHRPANALVSGRVAEDRLHLIHDALANEVSARRGGGNETANGHHQHRTDGPERDTAGPTGPNPVGRHARPETHGPVVPDADLDAMPYAKAGLAQEVRASMDHHGGDAPTLVGPPLSDEAIRRQEERDQADTQVHDDLVSQVLAADRDEVLPLQQHYEDVRAGLEELGEIKTEVDREHRSPLNRLKDFAGRVYHLRRDMKAARAGQRRRDAARNELIHSGNPAIQRYPEIKAFVERELEKERNQREIDAAALRYRRSQMTPVGRWLHNVANIVGLRHDDELDEVSLELDQDGYLRGEESVLAPLRENHSDVISVYDPAEDISSIEVNTHTPAFLHEGRPFTNYGMPIIGWVFIPESNDRYAVYRTAPWTEENRRFQAMELARVNEQTGQLDTSTAIHLIPDPEADNPDAGLGTISFRTPGGPVQVTANLNENNLRLSTRGDTPIHLIANPGFRDNDRVPQAA